MTCIVAIKSNDAVIMAGDRGASSDDIIFNLSKPKVHKNGPYIFGYAGSMEGQRMYYSFDPPKPHADEDLDEFMHTKFLKALKEFYDEWWIDTSKDSDVSLLIGIGNKLYEHHAADMSLNEYSSGYISIGSGSPYALGYLYGAMASDLSTDKLVENAVKAAIKFSPTCSGSIDIVST